jgi:hypothetical protein
MTVDFDTPVAFLVFNRPDCTARVFAEIRRAQPSKLLVVADGPRPDRPDEIENCRLVREIIEKGVDWPCEVEKAFASENMGCRKRVSSGLNWVFEQVEEAIILEDDCLPSPTFFPYCAELLARFRADKRIMAVCGCNHGVNLASDAYSYAFSHVPHIWGWATWRRAWAHYDVSMKTWPEFRDRHLVYDALPDPGLAAVWENAFEGGWNGQSDTWDFQWVYTLLSQNGLALSPSRNLITNLGFGADATHTKDPVNAYSRLKLEAMDFPLRHDPHIVAATRCEMDMLRRMFLPSIPVRIQQKLLRFLRKLRRRSEPDASLSRSL